MNILKINLNNKTYELEHGDKIVFSTTNSSRILRECKKVLTYVDEQIVKKRLRHVK